MNTNTTINPRVTEFLKLLESAGAVNAGGPLLSSWDIAEPNGENDNQVVSFSWVDDDGANFGYTLSEAGIAGGKWVGDCFFCEDTEGDEAQIRIFKLVAMVPDANCIEPSKGSEPDAFNYQLLARLKQDCEYYLGHGNRATKRLWAGSEAEQIATMKEIYAVLRDKPEWISLEDIARYEAKMLNPIGSPAVSQDKADAPKNALGQVAAKPFYIWANEDCANKSDSFQEAKAIRLALFNEGGESVHIVDAEGVEVVDAEIECHESLAKSGYFAGPRKPEVKPGFAGAFMVNDPQDPDGFAIVGDDVGMLILEAQAQLIDPPVDRNLMHPIEPSPSRASGHTAYEATEEDVENVLRSNSLAVGNTNGKSFEAMASELHGNLDFDLIEKAALAGDDLDEQTGYANDEIARQLRETGVLEPLKQAHDSPSPGL